MATSPETSKLGNEFASFEPLVFIGQTSACLREKSLAADKLSVTMAG
jgi:hypothetical protein